jgi:hypothetical protein
MRKYNIARRMLNEQKSDKSAPQSAEQKQKEAAPGANLARLNQIEDSANQQQPSEDQNYGERGGNIIHNTDCAEEHQHDSEGKKPAPGAADLIDARYKPIVPELIR